MKNGNVHTTFRVKLVEFFLFCFLLGTPIACVPAQPASVPTPLPTATPTPFFTDTPQPPTATATFTPQPSATPTPGLISPPAAALLPDVDAVGREYTVSNNLVYDNLSYLAQLPVPKENIGVVSFLYAGSNDLLGPQDGIYMTMTYAVVIAPDESQARLFYQLSQSDLYLKQAFLVIMPAAIEETVSEVSTIPPVGSSCAEASISTMTTDLFEDYRKGLIPTQDPQIPKEYRWYDPKDLARLPPDLYLYASCRVKNALVLFWGWTMNNADGKYSPLPDAVIADQVNKHIELIIQKVH